MARGAAGTGCVWGLALQLLPLLSALVAVPVAVAQRGDAWSLSRPRLKSAPKSAHASGRAVSAELAQTPETTVDAARAQLDEYLHAALRDPSQQLLVERVLELARRRDGGAESLLQQLQLSAADEPGNARRQFLLAQLCRSVGQIAAARAAFAGASAQRCRPLVLEAWARLEREQHEPGRAKELLESALHCAADRELRERLSLTLAELALDAHDFPGARARYRELAARQRDVVSARLAYARALAARSEPALALAEYQAVLPELGPDPRVLPALLLEAAQVAFAARALADAAALLRRAGRMPALDSGARSELDQLRYDVHRAQGTLGELRQELRVAREPRSQALLGRVEEELGDPEQALAAYRRVLAHDPGDFGTRNQLLQLLSRQGRVEELLLEYERWQRSAPADPVPLVQACQLLVQLGRTQQAHQLADRAAAGRARDLRLHTALAELYAQWNEADALERELALLAKLQPDDPARWVALAESELALNKPELAKRALRHLLDHAPDSALAHAYLGEVYLDHDLLEDARSEYEQAQARRPDDPAVASGLAHALSRLLRYRDAEQAWQRVLHLAGEDSELRQQARSQLIDLWVSLSELPRHLAQLEQVVGYTLGSGWQGSPSTRVPDTDAMGFLAEAYQRMARDLARGGDQPRYLQAAEELLARLVALHPTDVAGLLALERIRVRRGDSEGAIAALEQLTRADPRGARGYLVRMATAAQDHYRDEDAIGYARRVVELSPGDAAAHERVGDLYRARKDLAHATASYEQALQLDPQRFSTCMRLAELELAAGRQLAADALLQRIVAGSADDELVARAAEQLLRAGAASEAVQAEEEQLLTLALAQPNRPVFRRSLIGSYARSVPVLAAQAAQGGEAAAPAYARLLAIGQRAGRPLLEALTDRDADQLRLAVLVLSQVQSPLADTPLLAVAENAGLELGVRRAALLSIHSRSPERWQRALALVDAPELRLRDAAAWLVGQLAEPQDTPVLRELCAHRSQGVRAQALLALAARSEPADSALLEEHLRTDRSAWVRAHAALGLGLLGTAAALPVLTAAVSGGDSVVVVPAIDALGLLGDLDAAPWLAQAVFSSDAQARQAALVALQRLAAPGAGRLQLITLDERMQLPSLLDTLGLALRTKPAASLERFVPELQAAALSGLRAGDDQARLVVVQVLDAAQQAAPESSDQLPAPLALQLGTWVGAVLVQSATRSTVALRVAVSRALRWLPAAQAMPALAALLGDSERLVREAALDSLASTNDPPPPALTPALAQLATGHPSFALRLRAVAVLSRAAGEPQMQVLCQALARDSHALVRQSAAHGLARRGSAGCAAPALLAALSHDAEPQVRMAAARALSVVGGQALRAALADRALPAALRAALRAQN